MKLWKESAIESDRRLKSSFESLVAVSSMDYSTYTAALSTWSSSRILRRIASWEISSLDKLGA